MMKVKNVLFFVLAVIAMLGVIMLIFPKNGVRLWNNFTLYFPDFEEMLYIRTETKINADSLLKNRINIDDINLDADTVDKIESIKKQITLLEFPENKPDVLYRFYEKLSRFGKNDRIRIMHYGDSQIEGDRITADLRNKFQSKFGGRGVGLARPVNIYSQISLVQSNSDNWKRYAGFFEINTAVKHNMYGPMIAFNRYAPVEDSASKENKTHYFAWLEFKSSHLGYSNTGLFKNISVYYGNSPEKVKITLSSDGEILIVDSLNAGTGLFVFKYASPKYLNNIKLEFEGCTSPDVYTVSLEDDYGVYVDNIGLRGSSGDIFAQHNIELLQKSYSELKPDMFILQFGGNVVPYLSDEEEINSFAGYFKHHILVLRKMVPQADIIVIGPGDMSIKEKGVHITYPNLENVINELRIAAHDAGAAYWDSYKAMGGKNSMPEWVHADPPLASADYVHFTPQGAVLIANMFYNALMFDYQLYLKNIENKNRKNEEKKDI